MTPPTSARITLPCPRFSISVAAVFSAMTAFFPATTCGVVVVERSTEAWSSVPAAATLVRTITSAVAAESAGESAPFALARVPLNLSADSAASIVYGLGLAGTWRAEGSASLTATRMQLGGNALAASANPLASIASGAYEPAPGIMADLAVIGPSANRASELNVPAPGSLPPGGTASDFIPEPGTIGFGLALLALGLGGVTKSVLRCWRMTSTRSDRGRE